MDKIDDAIKMINFTCPSIPGGIFEAHRNDKKRELTILLRVDKQMEGKEIIPYDKMPYDEDSRWDMMVEVYTKLRDNYLGTEFEKKQMKLFPTMKIS